MSKRRAFITGVSGQDGSYLAELLVGKGYEVHGLVRQPITNRFERIEAICESIQLHQGDLLDQESLTKALSACNPDEVYNLAATSFVATSWDEPALTAELTAVSVIRLLEAVRKTCPDARFYQASSSEMFGRVTEVPQSESTPFRPRSPYGSAKAFGHSLAINYRESFGLHTACGILYNHESPRRGLEFVTRKITHHAAAIRLGLKTNVRLGSLEAKRDWGYAKDYVEAMWLMLQRDEPDDYVIATGTVHSVRDCLDIAFDEAGIPDWESYVEIDERFARPVEVDQLVGDASKAREELGWSPTTGFEDLIRLMVRSDLEELGS